MSGAVGETHLVPPIRAAVLTVSDRCSRGERVDTSGPALVEEYASTTVVFPGDALEVSRYGDLVISIDRG